MKCINVSWYRIWKYNNVWIASKYILNFSTCIYWQLRTRRALLLYNAYGDSALVVLNGTYLNSDSTLLALKRNQNPHIKLLSIKSVHYWEQPVKVWTKLPDFVQTVADLSKNFTIKVTWYVIAPWFPLTEDMNHEYEEGINNICWQNGSEMRNIPRWKIIVFISNLQVIFIVFFKIKDSEEVDLSKRIDLGPSESKERGGAKFGVREDQV